MCVAGKPTNDEKQLVLVVGPTGDPGGRAVDALLARGKRVRALARVGADPTRLAAKGVEITRGDMLDPPSLERAMKGVDAVVTTAAGYTRRRKDDSLEKVDDFGNLNLVDAARKVGITRFAFTSILTCDQARDVPISGRKNSSRIIWRRVALPSWPCVPGRSLEPVETS